MGRTTLPKDDKSRPPPSSPSSPSAASHQRRSRSRSRSPLKLHPHGDRDDRNHRERPPRAAEDVKERREPEVVTHHIRPPPTASGYWAREGVDPPGYYPYQGLAGPAPPPPGPCYYPRYLPPPELFLHNSRGPRLMQHADVLLRYSPRYLPRYPVPPDPYRYHPRHQAFGPRGPATYPTGPRFGRPALLPDPTPTYLAEDAYPPLEPLKLCTELPNDPGPSSSPEMEFALNPDCAPQSPAPPEPPQPAESPQPTEPPQPLEPLMSLEVPPPSELEQLEPSPTPPCLRVRPRVRESPGPYRLALDSSGCHPRIDRPCLSPRGRRGRHRRGAGHGHGHGLEEQLQQNPRYLDSWDAPRVQYDPTPCEDVDFSDDMELHLPAVVEEPPTPAPAPAPLPTVGRVLVRGDGDGQHYERLSLLFRPFEDPEPLQDTDLRQSLSRKLVDVDLRPRDDLRSSFPWRPPLHAFADVDLRPRDDLRETLGRHKHRQELSPGLQDDLRSTLTRKKLDEDLRSTLERRRSPRAASSVGSGSGSAADAVSTQCAPPSQSVSPSLSPSPTSARDLRGQLERRREAQWHAPCPVRVSARLSAHPAHPDHPAPVGSWDDQVDQVDPGHEGDQSLDAVSEGAFYSDSEVAGDCDREAHVDAGGAGDPVLHEVASALKACLDEYETLDGCCYGGDLDHVVINGVNDSGPSRLLSLPINMDMFPLRMRAKDFFGDIDFPPNLDRACSPPSPRDPDQEMESPPHIDCYADERSMHMMRMVEEFLSQIRHELDSGCNKNPEGKTEVQDVKAENEDVKEVVPEEPMCPEGDGGIKQRLRKKQTAVCVQKAKKVKNKSTAVRKKSTAVQKKPTAVAKKAKRSLKTKLVLAETNNAPFAGTVDEPSAEPVTEPKQEPPTLISCVKVTREDLDSDDEPLIIRFQRAQAAAAVQIEPSSND